MIHAIPELEGTVEGVEPLPRGRGGQDRPGEIEYLMARGLDEDQATSTIVRGFLNRRHHGLPKALKDVIDETIAENEKEMF